jgi:hypothetical protein
VPTLGQFKIALTQRNTTTRAARFDFGHELELLDLRVTGVHDNTEFQISPVLAGASDTQLVGGDTLRVDYTLRAQTVPHDDYTIFAHLLSADGKIVSQRDAPPRNGTYSTSFWDAGEEVNDQFVLRIPVTEAAGDYQIEFGLYRAADGVRLPVSGADYNSWRARGDHLLLAPVPIAKQ